MKNCDLMLVRLMGRQVVSCHTKLKRKKRKKVGRRREIGRSVVLSSLFS